MKKRVVITGIGAITPVGNTVDEYWDSLKEGKHGLGLLHSLTLQHTSASLSVRLRTLLQRTTLIQSLQDVWLDSHSLL